jgi:hypothetical protein
MNNIKRMQELAGIKSDNNLIVLFKQMHENNIKRDNNIKNFTKLIKERKNVNNK